MITILPLIIVLISINNGEWGQWHNITIVTWIFSYLIYGPAPVVFIIFLILTLFNSISKNSAIITLISLIITYIFSTGGYGPRLRVSLLIIKTISAQLWLLVSVVLIGVLLIFIMASYLSIAEQRANNMSNTL